MARAVEGREEGEGEGEKSPEREEEGDDFGSHNGDDDDEDAPSHLPFPPSAEPSDVSTTVDPSYIISLIRKILPHDERTGDKVEFVESLDVEKGKQEPSCDDFEQPGSSAIEDPWEACGCVLWDLSVDKSHAEFMVENLLLEVLLANLTVSTSARVTEICLGIIGNLACHDVLSDAILSTKGLIETVINHLFLEDSACLSETCRVLTVSLQGGSSASWADALQHEYILQRILWIAENTLNLLLLEKTIELLLTIVESQEVASILLPSLQMLGLPNLLVGLLACEMGKVMDENKLERMSILDNILRSIEALSTTDICSKVISSNEELFRLLCGIAKLPDKIEVANLCASVAVIIANILTDEPHLASHLSRDFCFLEGLLDILPIVSTDLQARNALWSILARLLSHVQVNNMHPSDLQHYASVLAGKACLIEDDLDGHLVHNSGKDIKSNGNEGERTSITTPSLRRIANILDRWITEKPAAPVEDSQSNGGSCDSKASRLLDYCHKYSS